MAVNSGSFVTSAYSNRSLTFSWSIANQDIAGNYTDINWSLVGSGSASGWYQSGNFKVIIDGEQVYFSATRINLYNGTVVATGTKRIYHNSDGSRSFSAYAEAGIYTIAVNVSGSGSWELIPIPRQANITGADNFNDEGNPVLTYSNPAGNSVTELVAGIYNTAGSIAYAGYRAVNKTGSSYTFTLTEAERTALRNATPNSNSLTVRFYLRTLIGGNYYHSTVDRTLTIVNGNPTFNDFTYEDTNASVVAVTGSNQHIVKGLSTIRAKISSANKMVAIKGATPNNYVADMDTRNGNVAYATTDVNIDLGTILNAGTKRLNVRAYDSRNNNTLQFKDITVYDYALPVINATVTRLNNFEAQTTLAVSGTYSRLTIGGADKNTIGSTGIQYRYRETGGTWSSWINLTRTLGSGTFTCTNVVLTLDNTKSFEFEVKVTDSLSSSTNAYIVDVGTPLVFINSETGDMEVDGDIYSNAINTIADINAGGNIYPTIASISNSNANNITKTGIYKGATITNAPIDGYTDRWYIQHIQHTVDYIVQIAYPLSGTRVIDTPYIRTKRGGTWGTWRGQRLTDCISLAINTSPYVMAFPSAWTNYTIPFDITYGIVVGTRLTRQGSAVRVGTGVKTVQVTSTFSWYNENTSKDIACQVYKNGSFAGAVNYDASNDLYCTTNGNPMRLAVVEGDLITMVVSKGSVGNMNLFGDLCRMTVEAIE